MKKIVGRWGMVIEIDWRTVKLFDLSKARVRILMKARIVLPALIEVIDGGWVFTISVVVVGAKEERWVRGMGESTRGGFESHSWTGGRMLDEKANPMAKCWSLNGVVDGIQGGVESQKAEDASDGTRGKRSAVMGNNYIQPSSPFKLNSNKEGNGSFRPKLFGEDCFGKGKAHLSFEDWCRASNTVQEGTTHFSQEPRPLVEAKMGWERGNKLKILLTILGQESVGIQSKSGKDSLWKKESSVHVSIANGKMVLEDSSSPLGGFMPNFGSKKLWTSLSPLTSRYRQGIRRRSEPLLQEVPISAFDVPPWDITFEVGSQKA